MGKRDRRVDAYIARTAEFGHPILKHLRTLVHAAVPEVEETIKWGFPHFEFRGILCSMAAFKQHCAFGFWKASLMSDPKKILKGDVAMGHLGRISRKANLPSDRILIAYLKEAARLNDTGAKVERSPRRKSPAVRTPAWMLTALKKKANVLTAFKQLSPSHKREYIEWIAEAKTEETRTRRLTTALQWISEGKNRNWKYERR
jgi:uncharacterized protein YdeI (YjbR/CyaY-like superfamily)